MVNLFQLGLSAGQFWTQSGLDPSALGGGWRNPKLTTGINWSSRFWVRVGASRLQKYAKYCRKLQSVARNCIFLPESTNFAKNCWDLVEFYPLDLAWFFRIWPDFLYSCSRVWVAQVLGKQTCPSTCLHQILGIDYLLSTNWSFGSSRNHVDVGQFGQFFRLQLGLDTPGSNTTTTSPTWTRILCNTHNL